MASTKPPETVTVDRADLFLLWSWAGEVGLLPEKERPTAEQQKMIDAALGRIQRALSKRP
jgi:hypothetical protein